MSRANLRIQLRYGVEEASSEHDYQVNMRRQYTMTSTRWLRLLNRFLNNSFRE